MVAATVSSSSSSSSCRRGSHCRTRSCSFRLRLLVVVVVAAAAFGLPAARGGGYSDDDHLLLNLQDALLNPGPSACPTSQEDKHGAATSTATRMKVVHRHGPCSPLADKNVKPPSHEEILAADQARVESIQRRVSETAAVGRGMPKRAATRTGAIHPGALLRPEPASSSSSTTPQPSSPMSSSSSAAGAGASPSLPASSGRALGTGNYVVTVGLGTPAARFTVVFDTGSDTAWVQCRPCVVVCYPQKEPLFDPAKSSTYANVSCASSYCSDLHIRGCSGGHCLYAVRYGDGSYTVGFFAHDTLTLSSYDAFKGFRFGCGERNQGLFGRTAGLLGLGRGETSLTMQAYARYGGVFEYCLPAKSAGTGYLDFGPGSSPAPGKNAALTPMLTDDGPTFYFVALTAIRVSGRQLAIRESVFSTAGTLVDSGTVVTRLPPTAYAALRSAFAAFMSARGYKAAPAVSILDTCYDLSGHDAVALPPVTLVFRGGASLDVDASGIVLAANASQVCLAFAPNDDDGSVGIIGNTQQKTYGVLYDIGKKVVGFIPKAC